MAAAKQNAFPVQSWIYAGVLIVGLVLLGSLSEGYADLINENELARVNVYGHRIMSHDRLSGMLESYFGTPLNDLNMDELRDLFVAYPLVKSAKVTRHYPDELDIYIRELVPVAYINLGRVLTLDTQGILLPLPDKGMLYNLPIITRVPDNDLSPKIGEKLEQPIVSDLVAFLTKIRESHVGIYLDISEISYDAESGIKLVSATHGTVVLLGDWDSATDAVYVLSAFISGETASQIISPYQYIDLRFANQVIVKERYRG